MKLFYILVTFVLTTTEANAQEAKAVLPADATYVRWINECDGTLNIDGDHPGTLVVKKNGTFQCQVYLSSTEEVSGNFQIEAETHARVPLYRLYRTEGNGDKTLVKDLSDFIVRPRTLKPGTALL